MDIQSLSTNIGSNPLFTIKKLYSERFVVISKKRNMPNPLIYNLAKTKRTSKGWNLLSNLGEKILQLETQAYCLRDEVWVKTDKILPFEGYWYYTDKKENIVWYESKLNKFPVNNNLSLVSFGSLNILIESIKSYAIHCFGAMDLMDGVY